MSPSRRSFLRTLLALPIAATLDVEKLLWVPGELLVSVPALPHRGITLDEINAVTLQQLWPSVVDTYFTASPLAKYIRDHHRPRPWPSWERAQ